MAKFQRKNVLQAALILTTAFIQTGLAGAQEVSMNLMPTRPGASNVGESISFATARPLLAPAETSSEALPDLHAPSMAPAAVVAVTIPKMEHLSHPFWDRQNRILFAANGALAAADFAVTRQNLRSGGKELNPMTRVLSGSTPGLAANFAMETGGLIGVSYLFHKTGHHKLERVASYANLGGSAFAVSYGLTHR